MGFRKDNTTVIDPACGQADVLCPCRYKPKQLTRHKPLMKAVVEALCEMCCEPTPEGYDDAQELPPQKAAAQALDVLALSLNSQHVVPTCWQFAQ